MNWYVVKLVFQIKGEGVRKAQFDEHVRLIDAADNEEAFLKARIAGIGFEEVILNQEHGLLQWEFVNVADIRPLRELTSGVEVYSQIRELDEATDFINYVHHRAVAAQRTYIAL